MNTGQHYDANLSDVFYRQLELPLAHSQLGISGGTHGEMTGRMLERLDHVLLEERPDLVLVYGDTNSTLAGALSASKLHFPVAHVEAGLRSFNRRMPEEINRILVDHCSDLLFVPTPRASKNLELEGVPRAKIHHVGDVMFDVLRVHSSGSDLVNGLLDELGVSPDGYVVATIHRAENTDEPSRLRAIVDGLRRVATEWGPVLLPLHPRTRAALAGSGLLAGTPQHLKIMEPQGYFEMLALQRHARVIATDSGGLQKEAAFHGVPCVTLRDETEWVELVESGWNSLVSPTSSTVVSDAIVEAASRGRFTPPAELTEGRAAQRIVDLICRRFE